VVTRTIIRWTSPDRAARHARRSRRVMTAREFNQAIRDAYNAEILEWSGHIGDVGTPVPSCPCPVCQAVRFGK